LDISKKNKHIVPYIWDPLQRNVLGSSVEARSDRQSTQPVGATQPLSFSLPTLRISAGDMLVASMERNECGFAVGAAEEGINLVRGVTPARTLERVGIFAPERDILIRCVAVVSNVRADK
jgi:hypothetical protein